MRGSWRRWLPGPKHGVARGVAVFGVPGTDDPEQLLELLAVCPRLRAVARDQGVTLSDDVSSLRVLDSKLSLWMEHSRKPVPDAELGCYVGTVIVRHVPGSRWAVWPNGHPVVQLSSGRDVDVIAQAGHDASDEHRTLASIYHDAGA